MSNPQRTLGQGSEPVTLYLDANPLADRHLTGIGRYTARIALALGQHRPIRFFSNGTELLYRGPWDGGLDQDLGRFGRQVWKSPRIPFQLGPERSAGIFGCLRPIEKLFPFEISILHDFTPVVVPQTHSERTRGMFRGFFTRSLLSSDHALAVSHATKADAGWLSTFEPSRITVAHSGPSLCVESHQDQKQVLRRPEVGLVVSTLEPRKNPQFLLDWFQETTVLPENAELWWVGPIGWLASKRILKSTPKQNGQRKVRYLGVVSDRILCRLYKTAGWSIYPSLYEGFGFPVLDALRHRCPVLASYNSALREFESEGLRFFDPHDRATVDQAWLELQERDPGQISIEALDQHYSWDRVARQLLAIIDAHFSERPQLLAA